jgi:hypothetical protein
VTIGQYGVGTQVTDGFVTMPQVMLVETGLVYVLMLMMTAFGSVLVHVMIVFALPLAIVGAVVALAVTGYATTIITGLAVSLQAEVLPVTVIATGVWIAYSVGGGLFGVAIAAAVMGNDWPRTSVSTSASSA